MNYYNPYMFSPYMPQPQYQAPQPQMQQQMMPTIQANIIQVDDISAVDKFSVGNGQSQMFITKDEETIFVKSGSANGADTTIYKKQPTPKKGSDYVTVDMLKEAIAEILQKGDAE